MFIITSDIHLTGNVRDAYRWELFGVLGKLAKERHATDIWIVGDLTDEKDKHPASLVNRIVENISSLHNEFGVAVHVVKGNHDYIEESDPFFSHWRSLGLPWLNFYKEPLVVESGGLQVLVLPHTRDPENGWSILDGLDMAPDLILTHMTFDGSDVGGYTLGGMSRSYITKRCPALRGVPTISGDIHVPQTIGGITYCGSPYRVRFGDTFDPRILLFDPDSRKMVSIPETTIPRRHVFEIFDPQELLEYPELREGDQVKVRLKLARKDFGEWETHKVEVREIAERLGVTLASLELKPRSQRKDKKTKGALSGSAIPASEVFSNFCKERKLPGELFAMGKEFLS